MTLAQNHITDTLNRAQAAHNRINATIGSGPSSQLREAVSLFIGHINTAVLFEHLRRLNPDLADQLVPWLAGDDGGIFGDEYAGELLHQWRQQLAAGQPMNPIAPATDGTWTTEQPTGATP